MPTLEDSGTVITQSLAIIEYLDSIAPEPRLIPEEPAARARVQALAQVIACDIHPINNLRVLNYLREHFGQDDAGVAEWVRHWMALGFEGYEGLISGTSNGEVSVDDSISLADVCLVPQVYNAERFGCDLSPYPKIRSVNANLSSHPAFHGAAPEQQPDAE